MSRAVHPLARSTSNIRREIGDAGLSDREAAKVLNITLARAAKWLRLEKVCINLRSILKFFVVAVSISGCGTPQKMSTDLLASIGVRTGNDYWSVEQKLVGSGYQCFVSGAKRENFDCTKTEGFFPSCLLRIEFKVDESNAVSSLRVAEPACIGTP